MQLEQVVQYSSKKYWLSNICMNCVYIIKMLANIICRSETLVEGTVLVHFTEKEVSQAELTMNEINPKMYHGIQVSLSRLAAKAEQLIDNVTTNLAEYGCMCLHSMMGKSQ